MLGAKYSKTNIIQDKILKYETSRMGEMNLNIYMQKQQFQHQQQGTKKQCNTNKLTNKNIGKSSKQIYNNLVK